MTDHSIIFSGEMVRAILDGRKAQTRRVMKPQPPRWLSDHLDSGFRKMIDLGKGLWGAGCVEGNAAACRAEDTIRCPYGKPGDRLWVRESCWFEDVDESPYGTMVVYRADNAFQWFSNDNRKRGCRDADSGPTAAWIDANYTSVYCRSVPSIHMPRWASRITLELTDVRVERVQEISEADCKAEGCSREPDHGGFYGPDGTPLLKPTFRVLWDSLNAKRGYGWDTNPWVWVLTFKQEKSDDRTKH